MLTVKRPVLFLFDEKSHIEFSSSVSVDLFPLPFFSRFVRGRFCPSSTADVFLCCFGSYRSSRVVRRGRLSKVSRRLLGCFPILTSNGSMLCLCRWCGEAFPRFSHMSGIPSLIKGFKCVADAASSKELSEDELHRRRFLSGLEWQFSSP
jgi:hypothetical protein